MNSSTMLVVFVKYACLKCGFDPCHTKEFKFVITASSTKNAVYKTTVEQSLIIKKRRQKALENTHIHNTTPYIWCNDRINFFFH